MQATLVSGWKRAVAMAVMAFGMATASASAMAAEPMADEAADLINALRARLPGCGEQVASAGSMQRVSLPVSLPRQTLTWNPKLAAAAEEHARAMAEQNFFSHVDPQGRDTAYRVSTTGYRWRAVGENLAAGQRSLEEAIRGWTMSEGHCRNMLDERFTEFGIARVASTQANGRYKVYWALVFGRPSVALQTAALASTSVQQ